MMITDLACSGVPGSQSCLLFWVNNSLAQSGTFGLQTNYSQCSKLGCSGNAGGLEGSESDSGLSSDPLLGQGGLNGFCKIGTVTQGSGSDSSSNDTEAAVVWLQGDIYSQWCMALVDDQCSKKKCVSAIQGCKGEKPFCYYWFACSNGASGGGETGTSPLAISSSSSSKNLPSFLSSSSTKRKASERSFLPATKATTVTAFSSGSKRNRKKKKRCSS